MLNTEIDSPAMRARVVAAAEIHFGRSPILAVFEHGQWWVMHPNPEDDGESDCLYCVVDAEGLDTTDGFDFERVSP